MPATVEQEERAAIQTDGRKWISPADRALAARRTRRTHRARRQDARRGVPRRAAAREDSHRRRRTGRRQDDLRHAEGPRARQARGARRRSWPPTRTRTGFSSGSARTRTSAARSSRTVADAARAELAQRVRDLPLILVDSEDEGGTIEAVAEELARRAAKAPVGADRRLGSDLPSDGDGHRRQSARSSRSRDARAQARGPTIRARASSRRREVSRGWYRNSNERIDPLAAFKESGGIEYGAAVAIAMVNVKGEDDLVDVVVAKNRLGRKDPFRLKLSFVSARFNEVDLPDEDERDAGPPIREGDGSRSLGSFASEPTYEPERGFSRARRQRREVLETIEELLGAGEIAIVEGCFRARPPTWVGKEDDR